MPCQEITHSGQRCHRECSSKYCWQHGGKSKSRRSKSRKSRSKSRRSKTRKSRSKSRRSPRKSKTRAKKEDQRVQNYSREYMNYLFSITILNNFVEHLCQAYNNYKCQYELNAILERFLLSINTENPNTVPFTTKISSDNKFVKKLLSELSEKRYFFVDRSINKYQLTRIVKDYLITQWNHHTNSLKYARDRVVPHFNQIHFETDRISFDQITVSINPVQLKKLIKYDPFDVMIMILRYQAHLIAGQQWALPYAFFDHLYKNHHARYEAFSSPLNSRFMGLKDGHFCSAFPDVDAPFGSMGNFFEINMIDPLGKSPQKVTWAVNPPFIESIMTKTVEKCLRAVKSNSNNHIDLKIFGIIPAWFDSQAYLLLKNSKHVKYLEVLQKDEHFFQSDQQIIAKFKSIVYVMDNLDNSDIVEYQKTFDHLKL